MLGAGRGANQFPTGRAGPVSPLVPCTGRGATLPGGACRTSVEEVRITGKVAKTVIAAAQAPDTERLEAADCLCHLPAWQTAAAPRKSPPGDARPRNEMAAREAPRGQRFSPPRLGGERYRRANSSGKLANSTSVSLPGSTVMRLLEVIVRPSRTTSAFRV